MAEGPLLQDYADPALVALRLRELEQTIARPLRLMEVCGTHTMALFETGLRGMLSKLGVELLSGPGCPVCVTSLAELDFALALAAAPGITLCTFGDLMRVPGTTTNLAGLRAQGAEIQVMYSPLDAVALAAAQPQRSIVFLGIGFETTAPGVALAVRNAQAAGLNNFYILSYHKTIPPALLQLAADPELALDGFICPGHVSVIIGSDAYQPVAQASHKPCVVTGFEPLDIMEGVLRIARQVAAGEAKAENGYGRVVRATGNAAALRVIADVFQPADAEWRGLGVIPGSGLELRETYAAFNARRLLPGYLPPAANPELQACRCGEVLTGRLRPDQCGCFGASCTPAQPLGACMVSQEGACRAYHRYHAGAAG